jgi:hypothetical protein
VTFEYIIVAVCIIGAVGAVFVVEPLVRSGWR